MQFWAKQWIMLMRSGAFRKGIIRVNLTSDIKSALFQVIHSCAPRHLRYTPPVYLDHYSVPTLCKTISLLETNDYSFWIGPPLINETLHLKDVLCKQWNNKANRHKSKMINRAWRKFLASSNILYMLTKNLWLREYKIKNWKTKILKDLSHAGQSIISK